MRLTAGGFLTWKSAYSAAQLEKEKTSLALWQWSLSLHRKVVKLNGQCPFSMKYANIVIFLNDIFRVSLNYLHKN